MTDLSDLRYKTELYDRRYAWHFRELAKVKSKPYAKFFDGHLHVGVASKHRLKAAKMLHTIRRIKDRRNDLSSQTYIHL